MARIAVGRVPSFSDYTQIHHVESEQWLGSLLHANDELVMALMTFEQLDRSIDADSDSDDELAEQAHMYRSSFSCLLTPTQSSLPVQPLISLSHSSDVGASQVAYLPQ